jgi:hypothetical protein
VQRARSRGHRSPTGEPQPEPKIIDNPSASSVAEALANNHGVANATKKAK